MKSKIGLTVALIAIALGIFAPSELTTPSALLFATLAIVLGLLRVVQWAIRDQWTTKL